MSAKRKSVRIGVIGAGSIGKAHVKAATAVGAELVAVVDVNSKAAEALGKEFNVPDVETDYKKLLARDDVDAITVALPNFLHAPVSLAALKAGKHVFCEKPMAMNVAECKKVNEAAKKAKKVFQVGLHQRHQADSRIARQMIAEGRLGGVYHAIVRAIRRRGVPGRGGWFTTKSKAGGGPMADIGVHMLDLTCWLMGHPKPVAVSAQTYRKIMHRDDYTYTGMWATPVAGGPTDVEDYVAALIRFEGGVTATLECAWAANVNKNAWDTQILGDQAGLFLEPGGGLTLAGQDGQMLTDVTPTYRKADPFQGQFGEFLDACRTGKAPSGKSSASGAQGQYVQCLIDAIYKSSDSGKEVAIKATDLPKK